MKNNIIKTAKTLTDLTKISTSCYKSGELFFTYSSFKGYETPPGLFLPHFEKLGPVTDPIGYIVTAEKLIFGIINIAPYYLVIGPILSPGLMDGDYRRIAEMINSEEPKITLTGDNIKEHGVVLSIQSVMSLLMNTYMLLNFDSVSGGTSGAKGPLTSSLVTSDYYIFLDETDEDHLQKASLAEFFYEIISSGNEEGMRDWLRYTPSMKYCAGVTDSALRNAKNSFIVASTLASRLAVKGGLDMVYALDMHEKYVGIAEACKSEKEVFNLHARMFLDFTAKVAKLKEGNTGSILIRKTINYIQRNLYSRLRTEEIAKAMFVSRTYLSTAFHNETGKTISDYIRDERIKEAKKLLKHSDKSLSAISHELGFSSQSYFTRVFKSCTGFTPKEYQNRS